MAARRRRTSAAGRGAPTTAQVVARRRAGCLHSPAGGRMSTTPRTPDDASSVGRLLQHWRKTRAQEPARRSRSRRASRRGTSASSRSGARNPSREMVMLLAGVLDVPLRDRNTLLLAAGYAPVYRETGLEAPEMAQAKKAVDLILAHQEPYPAVVMDRYWNIVRTNGGRRAVLRAPARGRAARGRAERGAPDVRSRGAASATSRTGRRSREALVQRVHREALGGTPDERDAGAARRGAGLSGRAGALPHARPAGRVPGAVPRRSSSAGARSPWTTSRP